MMLNVTAGAQQIQNLRLFILLLNLVSHRTAVSAAVPRKQADRIAPLYGLRTKKSKADRA